jgi:Sulfotransferase family
VRRARSPRVAFWDRHRDVRRCVVVVSSGRSGSTWLSEVLVAALGCRFIFEPLRRDRVAAARQVRWGQFIEPDDPASELSALMTRILSGRLRSRWSDRFNRKRLPSHRHMKEIRATNLLPWLCRHYPDVPIVYLLRHPVPTAWSATRLGWDPLLGEFLKQPDLMDGPLASLRGLVDEVAAGDDLFLRHVLRWCLENKVPTEWLVPGSVHVVFFEDLATDPEAEFGRLTGFLGRYPAGRWRPDEVPTSVFATTSRSNWRGLSAGPGAAELTRWMDDVPGTSVERALELVGAFGLDRLYGSGPRPRVGPDEALLGPGPTDHDRSGGRSMTSDTPDGTDP